MGESEREGGREEERWQQSSSGFSLLATELECHRAGVAVCKPSIDSWMVSLGAMKTSHAPHPSPDKTVAST